MLKWHRTLDVQRLERARMNEVDGGGVEHEARPQERLVTGRAGKEVGAAVEFVANDGAGEAVCVGGVHPQLVGAACLGEELNACDAARLVGVQNGHSACVLLNLNDFVSGATGFAVFVIDHLTRAVDGVAAQGKGDESFVACRPAVEQGGVGLSYRVLVELVLQVTECVACLGDDEDAARVLVEAVDWCWGVGVFIARIGRGGIVQAYPVEHAGLGIAARNGEKAAGLVDDHDGVVFVEGADLCEQFAVVTLEKTFFDIESLQHEVEQRTAFLVAGGVELSVVAHFVFGRTAQPKRWC